MPTVIELQSADSPRDSIHEAVRLLSAGELVALPTETVYVVAAHALQEAAVTRLKELSQGRPLTLGIKGSDEALDYVPDMSNLAKKLSRRCWPGPVTFAFPETCVNGLLGSFPEGSLKSLRADHEIRFRAPAHEIINECMRLMTAPLVMTAETIDSSPAARNAQEIVSHFGERLALVLDDGETRYGQAATIVSISNEKWSIMEPGVASERVLSRMAGTSFLFVCTGNTCRSPMAEGYFRKMLADKLKCSEADLEEKGYIVQSAGLAAAGGMAASPESVQLMSDHGIDITTHQSQQLTERLLEQSDHIYTMTRGHREAILSSHPQYADRIHPLACDGTDIPDPIGGGLAEYEHCRAAIEKSALAILKDTDIP